MDFKTSLFDFNFDFENYIDRLDRLLWASDIEPVTRRTPVPEVCELPEVVGETIDRLGRLAERALDSGRMEAYFRILDELDRYRNASEMHGVNGRFSG